MSDHSAVLFSLLGSQVYPSPIKLQRNFRKMDIGLAKVLLSEVNWNILFEPAGNNVQTLWNTFSCVMEEVFSATVPSKVIS